MIPCDSDKIYRWNALDDLDDGISDHVNDDLIVYDDPDLVMMDSFMSAASSVDDSDESREGRARDSFHDFSGEIDEDGLILALDDRTNRIDHSRNDSIFKSNNSSNCNSNSNNVVTVRVKKSIKYGSQNITASNNKDNILRQKTNQMDSSRNDSVAKPNSSNNIVTVRVKKSAKYGSRDITDSACNSTEIVRPTISTVYSDVTIDSVSPTSDENIIGSSAIIQRQSEYPEPRIATIHSDGSISYNTEKNNAKRINDSNNTDVDKSIPTVATINSDGTITYRLGDSNGNDRSSTDIVETKSPATVATIHSDGLITYTRKTSGTEHEDRKSYQVLQHTPIKPYVSFDNVVTDIELDDISDEDDDLDDDICDNLDNSRYTRSLHSMPVLEEVTEEESPLHAESIVGTKGLSTPKDVKHKNGPTWLELKKSPSAITTMTPGRSNDESRDDDRASTVTEDKGTSGWQKLSGLVSACKPSRKKAKHGGKYACMDGTSTSTDEKQSILDAKSSRGNAMLRVETCSTGSHSENGDFSDNANDLEVGGSITSSSIGRAMCYSFRSRTPNSEDWSDGKAFEANKSRHCCIRRRYWIAAIVFVLIAITVGISSFLIMHNIFIKEGASDQEEGQIEEWMTEGSPWAIDGDTSGSDGSTGSNEFEDSFDTNIDTPSMVPTDVVGFKAPTTSSPTPSPTTTKRVPVTSISPVPAMPSPAPVSSPTILTPSSTVDRMIPALQDTETINKVIRRARREIELLIFEDNDLIGKILRLVFHDCVGGCDGCVDLTNPENNGLDNIIEVLQPIADRFRSDGLSRTDIWVMASLVASELALPFESSDLTFPVHWIGRQTCESRFAATTNPVTGHCGLDFGGNPTPCSPARGPHVDQPHGTLGTKSILDFFKDEFGFDAQQVTAIMGAHSVGRLARENVGFMGTWDLSPGSLDSGYWLELVGNPPDFFVETIDNSDLPNIPNRHQWRGIIKDMDARTVAMLNVDVALVRNVEDMDAEGNVGCAGPGVLLKDCPSDTPFLPFAKQYNGDSRKFLMDFRDVLNIMIDHGHTKPTPTTICPEGRVCTFESNPDTIGVAVEELSPPPTPSPSRAPPKSFPEPPPGQPKVSLDRLCYENAGDTMVVNYDFVTGTDITFRVFSSENVDISQDGTIFLNPRVWSEPLQSSLSCGVTSCHTWTSRGGLQISTENLLGDGSDYVVLMFARTSSSPFGDLQLLAGDSFRLEGCND